MTITVNQVAANNFASAGGSVGPKAYALNCTTGSLLICAIYTAGTTGANGTAPTSVSDGTNGAWTKAINRDNDTDGAGHGQSLSIWYFLNNASTGKPSVSQSGSTDGNGENMQLWEITSTGGAWTLDATAGATNTSAVPDSGATATLAQAEEFAVAFCHNTVGPGGGTSWTFDKQQGTFRFTGCEYQVTAATTALHGAFTGSGTGASIIATFKAAAGGAVILPTHVVYARQAVNRAARY